MASSLTRLPVTDDVPATETGARRLDRLDEVVNVGKPWHYPARFADALAVVRNSVLPMPKLPGQLVSKPRLLSAICPLRSVVIVAFITAPLPPWSVYLLASAMGWLWPYTAPPTHVRMPTPRCVLGGDYLLVAGGASLAR